MRPLDLKVIETRLSQQRLEILDVAALLEEVKRLRQEQQVLREKLGDLENKIVYIQPVLDVYTGEANFTTTVKVLNSLMKRFDHTAEGPDYVVGEAR